MEKFNLCEAFFSGYYFFREEFASCALGYLLSPFSTGNTVPLQRFIESLLSTQKKHTKLLEKILTCLESGKDLSWENTFVTNPLASDAVISSAVEFKEIDILIKVDDVILLFENKIYEASVGNINQQIIEYKKSLGEYWQDKIVPITIYPQQANDDFDDIIALSWNGNEPFTIGKFIENFPLQHPALNDFHEMIKQNFNVSSRAVNPKRKDYDALVNSFNENYPAIIKELFPKENFAPGDDMTVGGCLLYRLPLKESKVECFPFRLMINGKCEILYQGLRQELFLFGKTFDGEHTIRDIIKEILCPGNDEIPKEDKIKFTGKYNFSYTEFADAKKRELFLKALELLERIDREKWTKTDFFNYYSKLKADTVSAANLREQLEKCLDKDDGVLLQNKEKFSELYRALRAVNCHN